MHIYNKNISFLIIIFIYLTISCRKSDYWIDNYKIIEDDGQGTGTTTWTKDMNIILKGRVFVNDGQVLTIEEGTVVRSKTGQGEHASALIVARGGKIIAEGSVTNPIIFTVEGDDLKGSVPYEVKGLWGGVILLGNAPLNNEHNEAYIEGIPISEPRCVYGGEFEDDNSGIMKYVSIRHGGTNLGKGNEINGLTLGGVGRQTKLEHIEVISNMDDGFEFFGGTVNCNHLLAVNCGDDAFDFDLGYQGKLQYILGIKLDETSDKLAEHNGGTVPLKGKPYTLPRIFNATFIGCGDSVPFVSFSRYGAGVYANSIFFNQQTGIEVYHNSEKGESFDHFSTKNIQFLNNIFYHIENNDIESIFTIITENNADNNIIENKLINLFVKTENIISDPDFLNENSIYEPIPKSSIIYELIFDDYPQELEKADYKGAFNKTLWTESWTLYHKMGKH